MKKEFSTNKAGLAPHLFSQAIESNGFVFLSGQVGADHQWNITSEDITEQTKQALENIKIILGEAGLTMDDIVKNTIYITNLEDGKAVNEVYSQYFETPLPVREMVQVSALPLGAKIEISAIATKL